MPWWVYFLEGCHDQFVNWSEKRPFVKSVLSCWVGRWSLVGFRGASNRLFLRTNVRTDYMDTTQLERLWQKGNLYLSSCDTTDNLFINFAFTKCNIFKLLIVIRFAQNSSCAWKLVAKHCKIFSLLFRWQSNFHRHKNHHCLTEFSSLTSLNSVSSINLMRQHVYCSTGRDE